LASKRHGSPLDDASDARVGRLPYRGFAFKANDVDIGDFEAEEQNGVLNVVFEEPPAKFVITPNAPVRQIWISALATSFKLDWQEDRGEFVHPRDGLALKPLIAKLINQHLGNKTGSESVTLH